jgi:hypothetical protein
VVSSSSSGGNSPTYEHHQTKPSALTPLRLDRRGRRGDWTQQLHLRGSITLTEIRWLDIFDDLIIQV